MKVCYKDYRRQVKWAVIPATACIIILLLFTDPFSMDFGDLRRYVVAFVLLVFLGAMVYKTWIGKSPVLRVTDSTLAYLDDIHWKEVPWEEIIQMQFIEGALLTIEMKEARAISIGLKNLNHTPAEVYQEVHSHWQNLLQA